MPINSTTTQLAKHQASPWSPRLLSLGTGGHHDAERKLNVCTNFRCMLKSEGSSSLVLAPGREGGRHVTLIKKRTSSSWVAILSGGVGRPAGQRT